MTVQSWIYDAKPIFADNSVQLFLGDSRELLPRVAVPDGRLDLLVSDPPYGISLDDGSSAKSGRRGPKADRVRDFGEADLSLSAARTLAYDVGRLASSVMVLDSSCYWFASDAIYGDIVDTMRHFGWTTRPCAWVKTNAPPPMPGCFPGGLELICHAYRGQRPWNKVKWCRAVIEEPSEPRQSEHEHPTRKPLRVIERILLASAGPETVLLDPFAGSGSTLVAARALGLRAIGIEVNQRWSDEAVARLSQARLPW